MTIPDCQKKYSKSIEKHALPNPFAIDVDHAELVIIVRYCRHCQERLASIGQWV